MQNLANLLRQLQVRYLIHCLFRSGLAYTILREKDFRSVCLSDCPISATLIFLTPYSGTLCPTLLSSYFHLKKRSHRAKISLPNSSTSFLVIPSQLWSTTCFLYGLDSARLAILPFSLLRNLFFQMQQM